MRSKALTFAERIPHLDSVYLSPLIIEDMVKVDIAGLPLI